MPTDRMISYAGNREDVLLRRAFGDQPAGFFLDVGAHHPVRDSVTKHFADRGWRGVNVEPNPALAAILAAARPRDVTLPVGLSDRSGTLTFYDVPAAATLSTFSADLAAGYAAKGYAVVERPVAVMTLAEVCERHAPPAIDFLTVDVEGHERQVLAGNDWARFRPRVVAVEATRPGTAEPAHAGWEHLLTAADYLYATFDGVNRYYVPAEAAHLSDRLAVPVNALDNYVPYAEYALEQELARYRALNPVRRVAAWVADVQAAIPRKAQALAARRRR